MNSLEIVSDGNQEEPLEWSVLWAAMKAEPTRWIATTKNMFDEMLGVVPPASMGDGFFLCGEPDCCNEAGEPVYACFAKVHSGVVQARYMTFKEYCGWKAAAIRSRSC